MRKQLHDPDIYIELDVTLHLQIASATHNAMLYHLVASIREVLRDTIREELRLRQRGEQLEGIQVLHEHLLTELQRGNAEGAGQAMAIHFDEAVTELVRNYTASDKQSSAMLA